MKDAGDIFDAIIVGGGPAGASLAVRLAAAGARVLLAEQERFPRHKLCGEFISPECLAHFARLGVIREMRAARGAEITETIFYAQGGRGVSVQSAWFGGAGAAISLSRAEMDARLLRRAREAGAEVLENASLSAVIFEDESVRGVRLSIADGTTREVRAPLTIDATGRWRAVARKAETAARGDGSSRGVQRDDESVRAPLVAFKAHLSGAKPGRGACEIYFYRGGYGGLSEIEGGLFNLCFIARAEDVRACASDAERVVNEVLMRNRRAAATLDGARAETRWLGVSLRGFGRNKPSPVAGLLAVGDAAAFIDPFTGSGMLMALESAELAAHVINAWLPVARRGQSSFAHLAREYERLYDARFGPRLRLCSLLRRAAFAPPALAEVAVRALAASEHLRRQLARATRTQSHPRTGTAHDYL